MLRKILFMAALCALSAMSAASAFGAGVWREGSTTGALVPVGSTLTAALTGTATLVAGGSTSTCHTGSFSMTVTSNTSGGSATGKVDSITFAGTNGAPCPGEIFGGDTITHATLNHSVATPTVHVTSTTAIDQTTTSMTVKLRSGITCTIASNGGFSGTTSNADNSISFTSIPTVATGFPCVGGSFTAKFAPVTTQGNTTRIFTAAS